MKRLLNALVFCFLVSRGQVFCMENNELARVRSEFFRQKDIQNKIMGLLFQLISWSHIGLKPVEIRKKAPNGSLSDQFYKCKIFSPENGKAMIVEDTRTGGLVQVLNCTGCESSSIFCFPLYVSALAGSKNRVAVGCTNGGITVYSYPDKAPQKIPKFSHAPGIKTMALSEDNRLLTAVDKQVKIWDLSGEQASCKKTIESIELTNDILCIQGNNFVGFDAVNGVLHINIGQDASKKVRFIKGVKEDITESDEGKTVCISHTFDRTNSIVLSPDGNTLAVVYSQDGYFCRYKISCYNLVNKKKISTMRFNNNAVQQNHLSLSFSPNGKMILVKCDSYGTNAATLIDIWEVETGKHVYSLAQFIPSWSSASFIDDKSICIVLKDGTINRYQLPNPQWSLDFLQANFVALVLATKAGDKSYLETYEDFKIFKSIEKNCLDCYKFLNNHVPIAAGKKPVEPEGPWFMRPHFKLGICGALFCMYCFAKIPALRGLLARILTFIPVSL